MIKPLLRILPSLSGNVKLACSLVDIKEVDDPTLGHTPARLLEANIRGAKIQPLTEVLHQRDLHAGLLTSSWEYDLQKYYKVYSDIFFSTCFDFEKKDMMMVSKTSSQQLRAQDFEWGAKRTSLGKDNDQVQFFAPFYIDDADDIPSYFLLTVTIHTSAYNIVKNVKVNIASNGESKYNYIYKYLKKYCEQIDDNVIFCTPLTNQSTYYGIDLQHGGFVRAVDNMAERLYHRQNTIQNFDATIIKGWEHNKVAMKQIIPMCFNFTVQDFLTDAEKIRFRNLPCEISGSYYTYDGKKIGMNDFLVDYVDYQHNILHMNDVNGDLVWGAGNVPNIMDVGFPSLNDRRYIKYEFSNKLDPWYCRWRMKLTDDEHPYVTNMSWAFSKNQGSNYRYGTYPSTYNSIQSIATSIVRDETFNYNLMFPLGHDREGSGMYVYKHSFENPETGFAPFAHLVDDYKTIIERFCTNWFSVIPEYSEAIYDDESVWKDVNDDCVYYHGILYDLRNVYAMKAGGEKIDKFAVIIRPVPDIYDESNISKLTFSDYTLYRSNTGVAKPNVVSDETLVDDIINGTKPIALYEDIRLDDGITKQNTDEVKLGEIFTLSYDGSGDYVDLLDMSYVDEAGSYHQAVSDYYDMTTAWLSYDYPQIKEQSIEIAHRMLDEIAPIEQRDDLLTDVIGAMKDWYDGIEEEPMLAYLQWQVYVPERITYDSAYVLDDNGNIDGTDPVQETDLVDYAYLNPSSYAYCHNESIIALHDSYTAQEDNKIAVAYLQEVSYIHHNGDSRYVMTPAMAMSSYVWDDEQHHEHSLGFSYLSVHSPQMNETVYGSTIYTKVPFILSSYNGWWGHDFTTECLERVIDDHSLTPEDISYWNSWCRDLKLDISKEVKKEIKVREYEYVPIQVYGGEEVAFNIMKERCDLTGRMYGDVIPKDKVDDDKDVLWADPYNLDALLRAAGKEFDESLLRPMFVKILDKTHLFYYYAELYKDAYRHGITDWSKTEWYKDLYVVEKKLIYDKDRDVIPEMKLVYTPLARWLNFPEFYDDETTNGGSFYRSFIEFYNELMYDPTEDLFYLPGKWDYKMYDPETDTFGVYCPRIEKKNVPESRRSDRNPEEDYTVIKFEIAFRKDMYRVGKDLWGATNMSADIANYRDVYFYRVQHTLEHDQKYANIKKIEYVGNREQEQKFITEASTYTYLATYMFSEVPEWNLQDDTCSYNFVYEKGQDIIEDQEESFISIDVRPDQTFAYYVAEAKFADIYDYAVMTESADNINHDGALGYDTGILQHDNDAESRPPYIIRPRDIAFGKTWKDLMLDVDSMLVPVFDDVFIQPASEALIYAHYTLHDISEAFIKGDIDPETGEQDILETNYRFDKNSKTMMVKLSDEEKEAYKFVKTYKKYENSYSELVTGPDDLGYGEFKLSTYKAPDGTNYGFYLIDSHLSNTSNSFKTSGITPENVLIDRLKYFKYINGVNITKTPKYIAAVYKNLLPFIKQQPLSVMADAKAMLVPQAYNIPLVYSQSPHNTSNGSEETDIKMHKERIKTIELLRYFHSITPIIAPTTSIKNQWNLKLKDVDKTMLDTGNYVSIGDSAIVSQPALIYEAMKFPVYTASSDQLEKKDYNNVSWMHQSLEYKHYMANRHILLDEEVKIDWPRLIDYDTMLSLETEENAFEQFKQRVNTPMKKKWSDDDLKFMLSKYRIRWSSTPSGLDHTKTKKLYKLTTIFELM